MTVRKHASKHDRIAELPLVTESATVVATEDLDRDRTEEVREAVDHWFEEAGLADRYETVSDYDDWETLVRELRADGYHGFARRCGALMERYERPYPMLTRIEFEPDKPFEYLAGQYVGLRYCGNSRAYSLASSPTRDTVEICVRRVPGGDLSPQLCADLSVGDRVTMRGPRGELVLDDPSKRDLVFLATGTGVAPFKGMADYVFETGIDEFRGEQRDVWVFLGAAWEDDLPYREAFREYASERDNFHFVPCLSRESYLSKWTGETDYVQHAFVKHVDESTVTAPLGRELERWLGESPDSGIDARIDPGNAEVYACGLNAMVHSLVDAAESVGVPDDRIDAEGFG
ncbi:ferredoxin--NADP reductase [Halosimplex aquaticum]|uniref:Ferredoxin--NADP reductase n=1 Tax=Halosimplex aquaticum TaxID=3026162 RepID=A0ABD5XUT9_9EURY|nr:FAD-dependent oxidoreductase [Halosimplex aquaticum]